MNADTLKIRDAEEEDLADVQAITVEAYQEYAAFMPPLVWEDYRADMLATVGGEGPPAERIVAELDGRLVGSVLLYPARTRYTAPDGTVFTAPLPELRLLAVAPALRRRGIGKALMEECVRRARASGAAALGLHTSDLMQVAMHMYERMGFLRAPETDFHPMPEITIKGYRLELL